MNKIKLWTRVTAIALIAWSRRLDRRGAVHRERRSGQLRLPGSVSMTAGESSGCR